MLWWSFKRKFLLWILVSGKEQYCNMGTLTFGYTFLQAVNSTVTWHTFHAQPQNFSQKKIHIFSEKKLPWKKFIMLSWKNFPTYWDNSSPSHKIKTPWYFRMTADYGYYEKFLPMRDDSWFFLLRESFSNINTKKKFTLKKKVLILARASHLAQLKKTSTLAKKAKYSKQKYFFTIIEKMKEFRRVHTNKHLF